MPETVTYPVASMGQVPFACGRIGWTEVGDPPPSAEGATIPPSRSVTLPLPSAEPAAGVLASGVPASGLGPPVELAPAPPADVLAPGMLPPDVPPAVWLSAGLAWPASPL